MWTASISYPDQSSGPKNRCSSSSAELAEGCLWSPLGLLSLARLGYTLAICHDGRRAIRAKSEFEIGAGDRIRTCDPRFKSSPRTPQDASSGLLLNSFLRISPPRGTPSLLGLAIQIGYTSKSRFFLLKLPISRPAPTVRVPGRKLLRTPAPNLQRTRVIGRELEDEIRAVPTSSVADGDSASVPRVATDRSLALLPRPVIQLPDALAGPPSVESRARTINGHGSRLTEVSRRRQINRLSDCTARLA